MKAMLMAAKAAVARTLVGATVCAKRIRPSDLQFIAIDAPAIQMVRVREAETRKSSAWRGGFNNNPANLDQKISAQIDAELNFFAVELRKSADGSLGLVARKHIEEGELALVLTGLVFDGKDRGRPRHT